MFVKGSALGKRRTMKKKKNRASELDTGIQMVPLKPCESEAINLVLMHLLRIALDFKACFCKYFQRA